MSARASVLPVSPVMAGANARRTRALAVLLMAVIASIFWIDSRYPALMKRYTAGTHVKASGALTFGAVYQVARDLPLRVRVWRTTVNWLDANRIGMTFSFLFAPAALTFFAVLPITSASSTSWSLRRSVCTSFTPSPGPTTALVALRNMPALWISWIRLP